MNVTLTIEISDRARNLIACQVDCKRTTRMATQAEVVAMAGETLRSKLLEYEILGPPPKRRKKGDES